MHSQNNHFEVLMKKEIMKKKSQAIIFSIRTSYTRYKKFYDNICHVLPSDEGYQYLPMGYKQGKRSCHTWVSTL
jgi:hypothetical protein